MPRRGTIRVTSPRDEDAGEYQCFAENEHGTATSKSVILRRAELKSFEDEPTRTVTAKLGEPFTFQCQRPNPDGWPAPQLYWLIVNAEGGMRSINNKRMTSDPEGNFHFSSIESLDASDEFTFACAAQSIQLNEYKLGNRIWLNVVETEPATTQYSPTLQYVTRKNEVGLRGRKVELFCIYGGTPLPNTTWSKNGESIEWNDHIAQGNYGKSVIIRNANFEDAGTYTCDVENGVGDVQSHSIDLKINAVPYFTVEPEIKNAAEGETVEFRCEASGVPDPEISWIHNGKPISEAPANDRREVKQNSIVITGIKSTDTGNYACKATNSLGYVLKDVYLNVLAAETNEPATTLTSS